MDQDIEEEIIRKHDQADAFISFIKLIKKRSQN